MRPEDYANCSQHPNGDHEWVCLTCLEQSDNDTATEAIGEAAMFKFVQWTGLPYVPKDRKRIWTYYHRLANAGRLQVGPVCLMWPLPWVNAVRDLPGYGFDKPSGVRSALGWKQKRAGVERKE